MPNELVHPNWHVILIHYPIALLSLGLLIEVFSFLYRHSTIRAAGRWMILLGTLASVPAATSGIYAFYDFVHHAADTEAMMEPGGEAWYQLVRAAEPHINPQQWDDLKHHIWRMAGGTIIALLIVISYVGASDAWRKRLHWPALLLMLFAMAVMASGAWHAGESVHTRGTGLERDAAGVVYKDQTTEQIAQQFVPPLQSHVVLAGLTVSLAAGALAASIRRLVTTAPAPLEPPHREQTHDSAYADAPSVQTEMIVIGPPIYAARFWLMAAVLALITAAAGAWLAGWFHSQQHIPAQLAQPRDLTHVILGGTILVLTLALAGLMRWSTRRKGWLATLSTLLFLALAAQIWIGILMLYDGSDKGASLLRFRTPTVQSATAG